MNAHKDARSMPNREVYLVERLDGTLRGAGVEAGRLSAARSHVRSRERGHPAPLVERHWIPAFAGMTAVLRGS